MAFVWDAGAVGALERLYREGRSASEIAGALGCSRSAVIGKRHRLGLHGAGGGRPAADAAARREEVVRRVRDDATDGEIAVALGITRKAVGRIVRKARAAGVEIPARDPGRRNGAQGSAPAAASAAPRAVAGTPAEPRRGIIVPPDPKRAVRFVDRTGRACAAILDETAPILERMVCGMPTARGGSWCGHHRRLFVERIRTGAATGGR